MKHSFTIESETIISLTYDNGVGTALFFVPLEEVNRDASDKTWLKSKLTEGSADIDNFDWWCGLRRHCSVQVAEVVNIKYDVRSVVLTCL